jgi:serine/threonine protein kinase/tetratricopeptide (TPR) repeat protein
VNRRALVDQLVSQWEDLRSRGEETSAEDLCRDHPELLETVQRELASRTTTGAGSSESPGPTTAFDPEATRDVTVPAPQGIELTQVGPFRIVKLIAEGGMGAVYEAVDQRLGRPVALKVIRPEVAEHERARARFLREAHAAAALEHDHIVRIFQVGEDRGTLYLAMQLLRGRTLDERLKQRPPLSDAEVLRIGREIAEGLAVAHARGLVHRDIKPANLWLEQGSGRVKVLDFGLARAANETARLTQDGSLLGTPAYMSPEQAGSSGKLDHRSDLFSLGSVLYRMATGRPPFRAESTPALLLALVQDDPIPPGRLNPGIPPALDALILELMAKDPAARPQSAQAVVETILRLEKASLADARDGLDLAVQVKDADALSPRVPKRFPYVRAALFVMAGLAAGSVLLLPRLLDTAGNIGELKLDSPATEVAVTVNRGGRIAGVLDPARHPTLRLPAGSYGLELADPTGTLVLARTQVDLRPGAQQVVRLVRNIPAATARARADALVAALERPTNGAALAGVPPPVAPPDGVLEELTRRAAGDPLIQAELARQLAARGNASPADAWRKKARASFEEKLAEEPDNGVLAAGLAQLLWDQKGTENAIRWTVLRPTSMESEGGATLTRLHDDSILADGPSPKSDQYTLVFPVPRRIDVQSIRLEALTHASLPGQGPGRPTRGSQGTFSMTRWDLAVKAPDSDDSPRPLQFRAASADHVYARIPLGLNGQWNIEGGQGKDHTSVWCLTEPVTLEAGTELLAHMHFLANPNYPNQTLGRFRLSVTSDPAAFAYERQRLTAMKATDPWASLAAAYRLAGDQPALDRLLELHPAAAVALGDLDVAAGDWDRAIAEYRRAIADRPADGSVTAKLAMAFEAAGRTREAVPHLAKVLAADPRDTILWLRLAGLQAWFGLDGELAATRQRILTSARDTTDATTAERAARLCSMLPSTDKALVKAALALARTAVKLSDGGGCEWLALGMAEYRSGNDVAAQKALLAAQEAGGPAWLPGTTSFYRAMSLFRQGKRGEARKLAAEAAAGMKPYPHDEENPLADAGNNSDGNRHGDTLILWLACKEAKAMIHFDAPVAPPGRR